MHTTRQIWYAVGITLCVITAIMVAAFIESPRAFLPIHSDRNMEGTNAKDQRTGTISFQTGLNQCEQAKFDNISGQMTEPRPVACDNVSISDKPVIPVPTGPVHRLEGIRKFFAGNGD
jgi:hypothetical protein